MLRRAALLLAAGQSVLLDATFLDESNRHDVQALAQSMSVRWVGIWLQAAPQALISRVTARTGDASDADAAVVQRQLAQALGNITWHRIATDAGVEASLAALRAILSAAQKPD
jgi:predicted kinase